MLPRRYETPFKKTNPAGKDCGYLRQLRTSRFQIAQGNIAFHPIGFSPYTNMGRALFRGVRPRSSVRKCIWGVGSTPEGVFRRFSPYTSMRWDLFRMLYAPTQALGSALWGVGGTHGSPAMCSSYRNSIRLNSK